MATVTEIAPDVYRISTFDPNQGERGLQFSQFLVRDDEPLLFETGFRSMFCEVRDAVATILDPSRIRWISFSHFEGDECGALNEWLALAPRAETLCSIVGAVTSLQDFASRPPRPMQHDEVLTTGRHRLRFRQTPHVPHCWDASLMFEETQRTLFASDLLFQPGNVEPVTESDVIERTRDGLHALKTTPLANVYPYTADTDRILNELADLNPRTVATHHGSVFVGDGARVLRDLAQVLREDAER